MTDRDPAQMRTDLGRNLTYGLLDALGRSIVTGHYDKRIFPTEAALAKQHLVSRSVTREAVKMLTAKGLLSARPRQGTIIQPTASWNLFDPDVLRWLLERKFSVELLRHFNQLRVAIEPEAAALAASHADAAQLEAIGEGLARMEEAEKGHDSTLDADIAFHESEYHRLRAELQAAHESSRLPDLPSEETRAALNDLLIRIRLAAK